MINRRHRQPKKLDTKEFRVLTDQEITTVTGGNDVPPPDVIERRIVIDRPYRK